MEVVVVRHGQTAVNSSGLYQGNHDVPLSEQGIRILEVTKKSLSDKKWQKIYTSTRQRTQQTAHLLTDQTVFQEDERLNERDFGIFEGKSFQEINNQYPLETQKWSDDWLNYKIPDGESAFEVYERVKNFMHELEMTKSQQILIITHEGIMKMMSCYLMDEMISLFWKFSYECGSFFIIRYDYGHWSMVQTVPHLQ